MKRKVALRGRLEREFSWSMSVEPGEWCLPKLKRHKRVPELLCDFAYGMPRNLFRTALERERCGTNSEFFQDSKETHGTVL